MLTSGFVETSKNASDAIRLVARESEYDYDSDSDLDEFEAVSESAVSPSAGPSGFSQSSAIHAVHKGKSKEADSDDDVTVVTSTGNVATDHHTIMIPNIAHRT